MAGGYELWTGERLPCSVDCHSPLTRREPRVSKFLNKHSPLVNESMPTKGIWRPRSARSGGDDEGRVVLREDRGKGPKKYEVSLVILQIPGDGSYGPLVTDFPGMAWVSGHRLDRRLGDPAWAASKGRSTRNRGFPLPTPLPRAHLYGCPQSSVTVDREFPAGMVLSLTSQDAAKLC